MAEEYFHRGRGPACLYSTISNKKHEGGCGAKLLDTIFFPRGQKHRAG